jgi:TRAP-type C4-dicarboxylate transport system permease small subunit
VRRETHFGFPLLAESAPPVVRAVCRVVARLAMIALGAGLAVFGAVLMADAWSVPMAGAALPVGLRFLPVAVGGALIVVFGVERLVVGLRAPAPVAAVAETA